MSTDTSKEYIEVECQNCRKLIEVPEGYVGCPFCNECMSNNHAWTGNLEGYNREY